MAINKIEHIGIAVKDLTASYKREAVESEGVITSFFQVGDVKIELLAATHSDSPIAKFIEKKGEGIHHIAFDTNNIQEELFNKINLGIQPINNLPKDGADNKSIAFLHPKSTNSVLMELCQEKES
jgi:methylmalonyl-CoA/ethylmalonyl-CoA epimerase